MRSRCDRSMPACTLNTRPESGVTERTRVARRRPRGPRGRARGRPARPAAARRRRPAAPRRTAPAWRSRRGSPSRRTRRRSRPAARARPRRRPPRIRLLRGGLVGRHDARPRRGWRRPRCGCSGAARRSATSTTPRKSPAIAHRPGDRHGPQPDRLLHLVEQLQRLAAGAVPLVDERQHRDAAGAADVEQLERLRLEALRRVQQHHGGVDGGQHAVGVLGEVAVARGVEQVDHVVAVGELQHRGGDRDAARLLHLHPVGRDPLAARLAVHRARGVDRRGVQGERLGERRLARVGVADHRERPAPGGLGQDAAHTHSSLGDAAQSTAVSGNECPSTRFRSRARQCTAAMSFTASAQLASSVAKPTWFPDPRLTSGTAAAPLPAAVVET